MKQYIALLRGINVGGKNKIDMNALQSLCVSLKFENVKTYLNTGNIYFTSHKTKQQLQRELETSIHKKFKTVITTLVLEQEIIKKIVQKIPKAWENNTEQKTDVAFLFPEIDTKETIEQLPVKKEYLDILYIKGALIFHVLRKNQNKSQLNKLASHKLYKSMTIRNINTARKLAEMK